MKIEDLHYSLENHEVDSEDFDLHKWRENNPMDYLLAMFLINKAYNKKEVFDMIYKISRLHIPDTLYKYYSLSDDINLNEQKLTTLEKEAVFMSDSKYMNDPFDNNAFFYRPDELKSFGRLSKHDGKLIDDFASFEKVTSLTANGVSSMPMWAHYSNNHSGYCVSYDMKNNFNLSTYTFPVQYTNQRIDITSLLVKQTEEIIRKIDNHKGEYGQQIILDDLTLIYLISLFSNIKHSSWSYEKEFRCATGANSTGMPFMPAKPKELFIGMKCTPSYEDRLIKIANRLNIPVYKMNFDEFDEEYNLAASKI